MSPAASKAGDQRGAGGDPQALGERAAGGDPQALGERAAAALDAGDCAEALALAQRAIAADARQAEAHFLAGLALLDLGRHHEAADCLRAARRLDADDAELAAYAAASRFILGDEAGAEARLRACLERAPQQADAWYWLSLVVERRGAYAEADAHLARAAALDPETYHPPFRLSHQELEAALEEVLLTLPGPVREALAELPVVIEELPSRELLDSDRETLAPDLLGLFSGVALPDDSVFDAPVEPSVVYLFQRNLERVASSRDELLAEARITLLHEIGHYLGLDEEDLDERDLS